MPIQANKALKATFSKTKNLYILGVSEAYPLFVFRY